MAHFKEDGTICNDDIFNYVKPQTQAEIDAIADAQKADRDASDAKVTAKIAILKKLGLTEQEAQLLLGS